jgi:hypothetical protein
LLKVPRWNNNLIFALSGVATFHRTKIPIEFNAKLPNLERNSVNGCI